MSTKPQVTVEGIKKNLLDLYGIEISEVVRFAGYDDINFGVTSVTAEKFVVKLTTDCSTPITVTHLMELNRLMTFVAENGFQVPFPLKIKNSEETLAKATFGQKEYPLRVFKYVQGSLLKSVKMERALLNRAAEYMAKLHLVLKNYKSEILAGRDYIWLLRNSITVKRHLDCVEDETNRQLVIEALDEFDREVLSSIEKFPHSTIHGDFNEANILVSANELDGQMQVTGLIDFSDTDFAPRVFDLSTFCIYMILETNDLTIDDLVTSYCKIVPLSELELSVIPVCMRARLAQSLVLGAYSYSLDPSNEYVLKTASNGWRILRKLKETVVGNN